MCGDNIFGATDDPQIVSHGDAFLGMLYRTRLQAWTTSGRAWVCRSTTGHLDACGTRNESRCESTYQESATPGTIFPLSAFSDQTLIKSLSISRENESAAPPDRANPARLRAPVATSRSCRLTTVDSGTPSVSRCHPAPSAIAIEARVPRRITSLNFILDAKLDCPKSTVNGATFANALPGHQSVCRHRIILLTGDLTY